MALMKVRRASFPFGDGVVVRGQVVDSHDFPQITESKWAQLLEYRYFEPVDVPGRTDRQSAEIRAAVEMRRARTVVSSETPPVVASESALVPDSLGCSVDGCGFIAKNSHGLKVHAGRRHRAA